MHINFWDFEEISLAHDHGIAIDLARFRAALSSEEGEETARVVFHGLDGNDYAVISTGISFWFIALTNRTDGLADFIAFEEHETLSNAMRAMTEIVETDFAC